MNISHSEMPLQLFHHTINSLCDLLRCKSEVYYAHKHHNSVFASLSRIRAFVRALIS